MHQHQAPLSGNMHFTTLSVITVQMEIHITVKHNAYHQCEDLVLPSQHGGAAYCSGKEPYSLFKVPGTLLMNHDSTIKRGSWKGMVDQDRKFPPSYPVALLQHMFSQHTSSCIKALHSPLVLLQPLEN